MDFRKIEWIFFVVFIGLNLFLLSIYWKNQYEQRLVSSANPKEDILQRFSNDGISYDFKISSEQKEGYYLSAEQADLSTELLQRGTPALQQTATVAEHMLTSFPEAENTKDVSLKKPKDSFDGLMKDPRFILDGNEYTYLYMDTSSSAKNEKSANKITGSQSFEGIPFIDATSRVTLEIENNNNGNGAHVAKYTQTRLKEIEPLREKMTLYSEKEILNTLYINNSIPAKSKVKEPYLGYLRTLEVRGKNVYVPVWFVKIEQSDKSVQTEKINAINNQIITSNLVSKVENP